MHIYIHVYIYSFGAYQAAVHRLSGGLLHLPQLGHKVPEAGLGHHVVGGKDPHAVQGGGRVLGGGKQAPHDFVLPKLWRGPVRHRTQHTLRRSKAVCRPLLHVPPHSSDGTATGFSFLFARQTKPPHGEGGPLGLGADTNIDKEIGYID